MTEYTKPWLSISEQVSRLVERGVEVPDRLECELLLTQVGYYRLTGYLYPFRESKTFVEDGRERHIILGNYGPGTSIRLAAGLIEYDRHLRLLVLDGIERIEVAARMRLGYVVGRRSPFAHLEPNTFIPSFTEARPSEGLPSKHADWLVTMESRRADSREAFVDHFRDKYNNQMPIWALTEIMQMGDLSRLYAGLRNDLATEVAHGFGVPTKDLMASWLATLNYVRNVAAHHARLFNRKLVRAPKRPRATQVPLLAHLSERASSKDFGVYGALAIMAYLLRMIEPDGDWPHRQFQLLLDFPAREPLTVGSMGVTEGWDRERLWTE